MKLQWLRPLLWVDNVKATMEYYVTVLGFQFGGHLDNWGWGYVVKDDVDAWWDILKDKAEIVYPVENFEYKMREFAIKDGNGYTIQFAQDISRQ